MTIATTKAAGPGPGAELPANGHAAAQDLVDILLDVASHSASLMAARRPVRVGGCDFEIPKFILLGQRAGGKPIRIALFGGIGDHGSLDGIAAITRLLAEAADI